MTVDSLVLWFFVGAWLVVAGIFVFGPLPRAIGHVRRIIRRLLELVDRSPLPLQLAKAEADAQRIHAALARLPALQRRAVAASTVIRTTPLVPPALAHLRRRIETEIRAFVQAAR
jgi:hypothetical protein